MASFDTIEEIRAAAKARGSYWWSQAPMRFFRARVHRKVYAGTFFISSERFALWDSERRYTIRWATSDGLVGTFWRFRGFPTRYAVHKAAAALSAALQAWRSDNDPTPQEEDAYVGAFANSPTWEL